MPKQLTCSTCAAPLSLSEVSQQTTICTYCGSTLLLPEEMWGSSASWTTVSGGSIFAQAAKVSEIARLIRAHRKLDAIRLYRETFGVDLKQAQDAIERLESGKPVSLISASGFGEHVAASVEALRGQNVQEVVRKTVRPILIVVIACVGLAVIIGLVVALGGAAALFSALSSESKRADLTTPKTDAPARVPVPGRESPPRPPEFARAQLEFGSAGIGAGQFDDVRSVAVDPEGRIYTGEYSGGRIQVFDAQGKFVTQWMVDRDRALMNLIADRRGNIYVVHPSMILRYQAATGEKLAQVALPSSSMKWSSCIDAAIALDGTLIVLDTSSNVAWIGPDGRINNTVSLGDKAGERLSLRRIAVDGSGNLFCIDDVRDSIFQFGPDGRYINRFGGKPDKFAPVTDQPGVLHSPHGIAVDGKGRVYVSDSGIFVFESNGRYVATIGKGVIFGMTINDRNEIFATRRNDHQIAKYALATE